MKAYVSVKEVCKKLSVKKSMVYRMIQDGEIPATKLSGRILIPEDELEVVLEKNRIAKEVEKDEDLAPPEKIGGVDMW